MTSTMASERHVAITAKFIDQNPSDLLLRRRVRTADGAGGFTTAYVDVEGPVTVRRVLHGGRNGVERVSESGHTVIPQWTLILMPDADVQLFDQFDFPPYSQAPHVCEIVWLSDSPPWRLQAEVYEHG